MSKYDALSPHCQQVLAFLSKREKPLTTYDILDNFRKSATYAPVFFL